MTESSLERKLVNYCQANGILCWKAGGPTGVPDRILHRNEQTLYIELKSPKKTGRLSKIQRYRMKQLHEHGIHVVAVDDWAGCMAAIETYL